MPNPWEMDWGNQAGPVYGPPPKPPAQRDPLQVAIDEERLDNLRNPRPNLPTGYEMGPDGVARRIPGLPEAGASGGANDVKLQQKRASLQSLEQQINRVEELYRSGLKDEALGIISSLGEFLPTETNRQFDTAAAGLAEQGLSAFRVPGVGAQSDTELRQFVQANRPSASDFDASIEEKLRQLRVRVDATRQEMGLPPAQWLGSEPQQQGIPAPQSGPDQSRNLAEIEAPSGDVLTRSTGGTQTVDNPALQGVRGEYLRRLEANQSPQEIIGFLRQAGVSDPKVLASAVQQANFRRQNPNVPIANYNTSALDDMDVPLSATESIMNDAAQSPLGAYGMNAGQAASFNLLDDFAPNQERAQIALADSQRNSPVSSLTGMVSGGLMAALAGEGGLARLGMNPGVGRALLADVSYGAGAGAGGAESGNRISGAATGGLAGLVGSVAGQGLTSAGGKIIGGVSSPSVRAVADQGVPMTVGQAVGQSGRVGGIVKGVEDRLSGVPVVGDVIAARRTEGVRAMNSKAFDKALEPIGETVGDLVGEQAVAEAQDRVGMAFTRALSGKTAGLDRQFIGEASAAKTAIRNIPRVAGEVESSIDEVVGSYFDPSGQISGENMQALLRDLGQIKRAYKNDPLGHRIGSAVGKVEDAIENLFRRQAPDVIPQYDAAKKAFRRVSVIEDAVMRADAKGGVFTPNQLGMADRANAKKFGGAHSAAAGRSEFNEFRRPMQEVLPNDVPDSGTAGRLATLALPGVVAGGGAGVGALTGDAQGGATAGLTLGGLLTLAYTRRGQGLLVNAAVKRGDTARKVGKAVKDRKRLIGASGATLAVQGTSGDR